MLHEIKRRPLAQRDLISIWRYIARDSEFEADQFLDQIELLLRRLAERPMIGRERSELADNLRSFPIGNYVVFYIPVTDGIDVVRVLNRYRDLTAGDLEKKSS